jgi:ABC-type cobalamin/Fe3+-siderophores transport system ATPase subunit
LSEYSIETSELTMRYGKLVAVDHVSFNVRKGEVFGFLGPNGAGKTTTIKILTTLLRLTGGKATVLGYDVGSEGGKIRRARDARSDSCLSRTICAFLRRSQPWTRHDLRLAIGKKPETPFPKTRPTITSFKKRKRALRIKKMSNQKYLERELTLRKESSETQNREKE